MTSIAIYLLIGLVVALVVALAWLAGGTRRTYHAEVSRSLLTSPVERVVQPSDLEELPPVVRTYLERSGVVGRPRARNLRAVWRGRMRRTPDGPWFPIQAEQHNAYRPLLRTFYIRGRMMGVPVVGRDLYDSGRGQMVMRVFGLVPVVDLAGEELAESGLVTIFNDMCLLSPSALLDDRIAWEPVDRRSVRTSLTDSGRTVSATLIFDEDGDLTDFVTDDRSMEVEGQFERHPWSTPVGDYQTMAGHRVPTFGEGVWKLPDGDFTYAEFHLQELEINVTAFS